MVRRRIDEQHPLRPRRRAQFQKAAGALLQTLERIGAGARNTDNLVMKTLHRRLGDCLEEPLLAAVVVIERSPRDARGDNDLLGADGGETPRLE